jgi:tungstate transport system permease protein
MNYIASGFLDALRLLAARDAELFATAWTSIRIAVASTALATVVGAPLGFAVAIGRFRGREATIAVINTLMAMPTVVIGLLMYSLLSRRGPFGPLALLYTPTAMVLGQFLLALPIVAALTLAAAGDVDPRVRQTALALGAGGWQSAAAVLRESQAGILAAVAAGFGRVFAEVGVSMMLGGNIQGYTRNIPTAIALETSKGEFARGIALGLILLLVALGVNVVLQIARRRVTA